MFFRNADNVVFFIICYLCRHVFDISVYVIYTNSVFVGWAALFFYVAQHHEAIMSMQHQSYTAKNISKYVMSVVMSKFASLEDWRAFGAGLQGSFSWAGELVHVHHHHQHHHQVHHHHHHHHHHQVHYHDHHLHHHDHHHHHHHNDHDHHHNHAGIFDIYGDTVPNSMMPWRHQDCRWISSLQVLCCPPF